MCRRNLIISRKLITCFVLQFAALAPGSPPPPLGWKSAVIKIEPSPSIGELEIKLKCPEGKFAGLTSSGKKGIASISEGELGSFHLPNSCSGARTELVFEDDVGSKVAAVALTIEFSSEYTKRSLWISWDPATGSFSEAQWIVTEGENSSNIQKLKLTKKKSK